MSKKTKIFIGIFIIFILAISTMISESYITQYRQGRLPYNNLNSF
jgi:hypothetical protein